MKLAIMQPYFFPYIGYFQLINAVDLFVIYDDVNFIKQGWINRNRILVEGQPHYLTVGLSGASSFKKINEIEIRPDPQQLLKTVYYSYRRAPFFPNVYPLIEGIINSPDSNLSKFVSNSIITLTKHFGISTRIVISSDERIETDLKGKDRVIGICRHYAASDYYNAIGGTALYNRDEFRENGIELRFVQTGEISYKQFENDFVPSLSIIDVMMFNSPETIRKMLKDCELL